MEALADMGELQANIQEAVRLFPPLILVMRYVRESFSVTDSAGRQFVIPKVGSHAALSSRLSQSTENLIQPVLNTLCKALF